MTYKTYLVALLTDIWGIAIALQGDPKNGALFLAIGTLAMTLRNAIKDNKEKKPVPVVPIPGAG